MAKQDRYFVAILADEHAGSKLGLCNPETEIEIEVPHENGGFTWQKWTPPVDKVMEFIWEHYEEGARDFQKIAEGNELYILKLGEVTEGTYYKNSSMDLRKDYQVQLAVSNMAPWKGNKNIKAIRIVPGDRPHEFDEGSATRMVAMILKRDFPNCKPVIHGIFKKNGLQIDYTHKGPHPGSRKWLEGNTARRYLQSYMMTEVIEFDRPPVDLLLRAHYHRPVHETYRLLHGDDYYRSDLIVAPCLKLPDAHARKATENVFRYTIGMLMLEVYNGTVVQVYRHYETFDIRNKEVF